MDSEVLETLATKLGERAIAILDEKTTPTGDKLEVVVCAAALAEAMCNVQISIWDNNVGRSNIVEPRSASTVDIKSLIKALNHQIQEEILKSTFEVK